MCYSVPCYSIPSYSIPMTSELEIVHFGFGVHGFQGSYSMGRGNARFPVGRPAFGRPAKMYDLEFGGHRGGGLAEVLWRSSFTKPGITASKARIF